MTEKEIENLKVGYCKLRQSSSVLKQGGHFFEGLKWYVVGRGIERHFKNMTLKVYRIEDDIEACLIFKNGESRTFA